MTAQKSPTILVVEDDPLVAAYVCEVLEEFGYPVSGAASTAPEALSLAERDKPDIAVLDIRLSGTMTGIDVAELLARRFHTAVIFLSGTSDRRMIDRAEHTHPVTFLHKPFRPSQLLNAIATVRDRSREKSSTRKGSGALEDIDPFCV